MLWGYRATHCRRLALVLAFIGLTPLSAAGADSYLQALKDEAGRLGSPPGSEPPTQPTNTDLPQQALAPADSLAKGLGKKPFEEQLQKSYYGSYLFYSTLDNVQQEKVYEAYLKDNRIESIRESIMSRLKK